MENTSKESFKVKLTEFFERHDPSKVFLVPKIADKFPDQQAEVFSHLNELYVEKKGNTPVSEKSVFSVIPPPHQGAEPV
ncbi:MAG: hypothetical protein KFF73_18255 [Cyclobacteriaceae bacterium]|nr:hypothetical protein [Cyclobacteriaceae bacterium]